MVKIPFLSGSMEEEIGLLTRVYEFIRRRVSIGRILILVFSIVFSGAVYLYAKVEFVSTGAASGLEAGQNPAFESLYWLVTTLTTVGYGDITPETMQGKILAMLVMLMGVSLLGFLLSQVMQSIVSTNLGNIFGVNRTKKEIDYIICGWNKVSEAALKDIEGHGRSIVIIDKKSKPELSKRADIHYIMGDATRKSILAKANIKKAKNILLTMDDDSQVMLSIHVIRSVNPWINIIAKIEDHDHVDLAYDAGADQVVSPATIGGRLLSIASEEPAMVRWVINAVKSAKGLSLVEYYISQDSPWVDKTVADVQKTLLGIARILGVDTTSGLERVPAKNMILKPGNKIILMVDRGGFSDFLKRKTLAVKV